MNKVNDRCEAAWAAVLFHMFVTHKGPWNIVIRNGVRRVGPR
jgi:hypothetical protein